MKILIAEDNAFSLTLLQKTLGREGYECVTAKDGSSAWEILSGDNPPLLALIDWMMPGISGVDLCRKLGELRKNAVPTYIILLTAKSKKEDVLEGFSAGADDFIKKPFDAGELLARIKVGRRVVEQQSLLYRLIDALPDPVYVKDKKGLYLTCNKAYADFIGADAGALRGRASFELIPGKRGELVHQKDLEVMGGAESYSTEGWAQAANGRRVYYDSIKIPCSDSSVDPSGLIGISRDLTRRIELEQEMRRLAVAVEQSAESVMIMDVKGVIHYVNAAFEEITGYKPSEVIGKTPNLLKSGEHDVDFMSKLWESLSSGKTWEGRLVSRRKDGRLFGEETVIYPIRDAQGNLINFVSIGRDVTREEAMEKQMRQHQKMNAIGELAGGVSHDFNNILTAILGYVALALNSVDAESAAHRYLNEILKAGERAAKLVRQILAFSRQEETEYHSLRLQGVIEETLGLVRSNLNNIQLLVDVDASCGPILGDATQLQQVLINLCSNAVHAIGMEDEGEIKIVLRAVDVDDRSPLIKAVGLPAGRYACVTVRDTGCGMSEEIQDRIFEPYFSTKRTTESCGFGLSIVHGIVRRHRGAISVESTEGEGTSFHLYFPLYVESRASGSGGSRLGEPSVEHVLFVDDETTILSLGREILESYGYQVTTATNGRQAWNLFKAAPDKYNILVTDYRMPKMNGHDLIRKVLDLRGDISIVLCSGYMEKAMGEGFSELKNAAFLPKPIDWGQLGHILKNKKA